MEEHSAIIGKTGAGKTYTAKGFAEDLLREGARFCVIDPTGVWWGLKSSADGESEGFPVVVFGGDHADVPLSEDDAETVARIVATTATPCVLDVSAFPSLSAQKRFMTDFAEHLFQMNREALHLFVDEADAFMPQRPGPDETVMLSRWDTIARRGRSRGFRLTLITQRPAVLNKNALSQVGTLIALKLTSPQDRKAVGDWIEGNADKTAGKALLASLPGMSRGEGWVWSPGHEVLERVQFQPITTWDSSRTPGKGEIHREAKVMAMADIAKILAAMPTPKAQRVGEIRTMPDADAIKAAREEGHAAGLGEGIAASAAELARLNRDLRAVYGAAADNARAAVDYASRLRTTIAERHPVAVMGLEEPALWLMDMRRAEALPADSLAAMPENRAVERQDAAPAPVAAPKPRPGGPALSPAAERMGMVLAERSPADLSRIQLGTLARSAPGGGAFAMALKALRDAGLYEETGSRRLRATTAGFQWAGLMEGTHRHGWDSDFAMWSAHLPPTPRRILEAIRDLGGSATRAALADKAGMSVGGGAWSTALKVLHDNEILTVSREGGVLHETSAIAAREAARKGSRS